MLFARQRAASLVWNGMIWMLGGREGSKILQHNEVMMYPGIYNGTNHKSWKWMNKVFISYSDTDANFRTDTKFLNIVPFLAKLSGFWGSIIKL